MAIKKVVSMSSSRPDAKRVPKRKHSKTRSSLDSCSDTRTGDNGTEHGISIVPAGEPLTAQERHWQQLVAIVFEHFHDPDIQALRAIYAAVAAHGLAGASVWLMLIGPPGSMKTEVVTALEGIDGIHLIDELTPNTFISGQIQEGNERESSSLLHRIGQTGILIFPDFSTLIGARSEMRNTVLAQLRRIYDGSLRREFGHTSAMADRRWEGRVTAIAAVTSEIDRHYAASQPLGERFLQVRNSRPGGRDAAMRAMRQHPRGKSDLKKAVHELLQHLPSTDPALPTGTEEQLASLAEYVARARSHVARDGYNKQVQYLPEPEAATRIAQQLAQLAKGSALIAGRSEVCVEDYALAKRAGLDSIPPIRRKILDALLLGQGIEHFGIPRQTADYAMQDLQLLGLLEKRKGEFIPTELAQELAISARDQQHGKVNNGESE